MLSPILFKRAMNSIIGMQVVPFFSLKLFTNSINCGIFLLSASRTYTVVPIVLPDEVYKL